MLLPRLLPLLTIAVVAVATHADEPPKLLAPGEAIDYADLAFFPGRWKDRGVSTQMVPWRGEEVVFLTDTAEYDAAVMTGLLAKLDAGWRHYADLTGRRPRLTRQIEGLPTMAAVPQMRLTCGHGCGYVGGTGIELGSFYLSDYENVVADPAAIPDYYFYEMGRNYYTFDDRHSLFVTGFAVFMRYVCLDELGLKSRQPIRRIIEQAEARYAETDLGFLRAFTTYDGLAEKQNRLDHRPTDQPVMYASAMLKLRADHGGDPWVGRFFRHLAECPAVRPTDRATALQQAYNWLAAASLAAGEDLSPTFADRWRMPLNDAQRRILADHPWGEADQNAGDLVARLVGAE